LGAWVLPVINFRLFTIPALGALDVFDGRCSVGAAQRCDNPIGYKCDVIRILGERDLQKCAVYLRKYLAY